MENELRLRIEHVRQRITAAAQRAGRDPDAVTLQAACKTVDPERIMLAIDLGIQHVGENWIQEAAAKFKRLPALRPSATWHMIGHLQTNKVRRALELFDVIQTIDSVRLAQRIDRLGGELGRQIPVYIEVNVELEPTKSGVPPDQVTTLAEAIAACPHLRLEGLMAVPPFLEHLEAVRPYFKKLRELRDTLNHQQLCDYEVTGLSMGMTHDFEVAVEEGATLVRVGTAIWGPRPE